MANISYRIGQCGCAVKIASEADGLIAHHIRQMQDMRNDRFGFTVAEMLGDKIDSHHTADLCDLPS